MRRDFSEIRRRNAEPPAGRGSSAPGTGTDRAGLPLPRRPREPLDAVCRALRYLATRQTREGGFPLYVSPCAYLNPAEALPPSRGATRLIQRCLAPLRDLGELPARLWDGCGRWLERSGDALPSHPRLPAPFERSFPPAFADPRDPAPPAGLINGLFWAERLEQAHQRGLRLPELERFAARCLRAGDLSSWDRLAAANPGEERTARAACRPFLPLLLLLQAPGPDLFAPSLRALTRDYLACRQRTIGGWGNPTDTALLLLCLQAAGHAGREMHRGAEKLTFLQEADGSWPPNAFYREGDHYYGSREVTTAWCAAALFLHTWGAAAEALPPQDAHLGRPGAPLPEPCLHPGIPPSVKAQAARAAERVAAYLPPDAHPLLYLGRWDSMPPHFLLPYRDDLFVGVNLAPGPRIPPASTALRPVETEVALALFLAARYLRRGRQRDRLERIFVLGLALSVCERLWPNRSFAEHAGLPSLDARWCAEHEPYLWGRVRDLLTGTEPDRNVHRWLLPRGGGAFQGPIPPGASLYVGRSLFRDLAAHGGPHPGEVNDLLGAGLEEILQAFRERTGAAPDARSLLHRRSDHETQTP